jgi:hypothetical protein
LPVLVSCTKTNLATLEASVRQNRVNSRLISKLIRPEKERSENRNRKKAFLAFKGTKSDPSLD